LSNSTIIGQLSLPMKYKVQFSWQISSRSLFFIVHTKATIMAKGTVKN
jgi:hypothetical protein